MFELIKKWFAKPVPNKPVKKTMISDEIRKHVKSKFIIPARLKKESRITFTAADIAKGMSLENRFPMICMAIDTKKFLDYARVELIRREGPGQSSTAKWTFKILA